MALSAGSQPQADRSRLIGLLRAFGALLPGDWLKTAAYRAVVAKPRRVVRQAITSFYRIDLVYQVLEETRKYQGRFSILEFGTSQGYAFTKMLYATRFLRLSDRVTVHAFDSFEGLPPATHPGDRNVVTRDDVFVAGQYRGNRDGLEDYCSRHYDNYAIHQGYFENVLTAGVLERFRWELPVLLWIDCDYYSSARTVMERILPYVPSGCVVYFDDLSYNYGSRLTGEARLVHEVNRGDFGPDLELVLDRELGWDSNAVYRLIRAEGGPRYSRAQPLPPKPGRARGNDSALP